METKLCETRIIRKSMQKERVFLNFFSSKPSWLAEGGELKHEHIIKKLKPA
jgi:hypothetical protein